MTRNHWMLLGFFLAIIGMFAFAVAPVPARIMLWLGVALAWFGMAVALQQRPWSVFGKLFLQILIGAAALAIAMTATRLSLAGIALAALLGAFIGAFAPQWSLWISRRSQVTVARALVANFSGELVMSDPVVIVAAVRTPMGGMLGDFASLSASDLGAVAVKAAVERAGLKPEQIEEVILGNCLMAGQGQAPARQATLKAGLPKGVAALTITKMCGSGMKAAQLAHDEIVAGTREIVVAGGMESMTNAPHMLTKARTGYRYGAGQLLDHMATDGLEDAYEKGRPMGFFAENCAAKYAFTRQAQDEFAIASTTRAQAATHSGAFAWEIAPVLVKGKAGDVLISVDEQPPKAKLDKIPGLKPAFVKDGTITAANASSISDGAAALVLMKLSTATSMGLTPLARIVGHAEHSQEPEWFTTAPVGAIQNLFKKTGWTAKDVDLFEINEAFAVVTMAAMKEFDIAHSKVNIHGGACALGHPIGASGARIIVTLIGALKKTGGKKGVAALCIGGGEAVAMAIEMI